MKLVSVWGNFGPSFGGTLANIFFGLTKDRRQKNPNQGNQKQDASRKDEKQACIPSKDMPCRKNKNPNCYTDCDGSEVLGFKLDLKNYISSVEFGFPSSQGFDYGC